MATCGGHCQQMLMSKVLNPNFNSDGLTVGGYGGGRGVGPGGLVPGGVGPGGLGFGIGMYTYTPLPPSITPTSQISFLNIYTGILLSYFVFTLFFTSFLGPGGGKGPKPGKCSCTKLYLIYSIFAATVDSKT